MKVVIDHIAGSRRGQRQELDSVARIRFGRHPENEVSFDAHRDLDASSRHAELVRDGDRYLLSDVGSSNGLLVDGHRVNDIEVPLGEIVEVAFGAAGPRVRLFIGDPDDIPDPPSASSLRLPRTQAPIHPGASHSMASMWREASEQSRDGDVSFVRALVREAIYNSSRRFKIVVSLVVTVLLAGVGVLVLWQLGERDQRERDEAAARADAERERAIREQAERRPAAVGPGPAIAEEFSGAVYLLVAEKSGEPAIGFCSGFAVTERHLATSAHCADEVKRYRKEGRRVAAVRNGAQERVTARKLIRHDRYQGGLDADVGLVEVAGDLPSAVRLASTPRLRELRQGANLFALGFPEGAAAPGEGAVPEASLVEGVIGRMTAFDGEQAQFEERRLVHHNLAIGAAGAGTPLFDGSGDVVAVNAGRYSESMTDVVVDPKTGKGTQVKREVLTPGANYAVRIDALREVLRENGLDVSSGGGK